MGVVSPSAPHSEWLAGDRRSPSQAKMRRIFFLFVKKNIRIDMPECEDNFAPSRRVSTLPV
jgi:hypothetical protein